MIPAGDPEVFQRAVQNFKPLVFSLISETQENVSTEQILEGLKKEETLQDSLLIIDARLCVRDFHSAKTQNGKGTKSASESRRNHTLVEVGKSPATFVREEYVKVCLSREYQRMTAMKEKEDYLRSLQAQYIEDGMTEDEALRAAREDLKDDEDNGEEDLLGPESSNGNDEDKSKRMPLYLCLLGYPNSIEDVLECAASEVPFDCLFNVISKAPTSGSVAMEGVEKPMEKSRLRSNEVTKNGGKRAKVGEEDGGKHFLQAILQRKGEQRKSGDYNAVDEVLVYTYEFLSEALPPRVADAAPSYRLMGSEKAGVHAISKALVGIEQTLFLFSEWKAKRIVVHVPRYTGLPDPDAPKPVPVEVVEEKSKKVGKSASKKGVQPPPEPVVQAPILTVEDLHTMTDVAACRERYDAGMLQHWLSNESFSTSVFVDSCIAQVSALTTVLADKNARAVKDMVNKKNEVGRFAEFIFSEIMGENTSYPGTESTLVEKDVNTLTVSEEGRSKEVRDTRSKEDPIICDTSAGSAAVEPRPAEHSPCTVNIGKDWESSSTGQLLGVEGNDVKKAIVAENLQEIVMEGIKSVYPFVSEDGVRELVEKSTFLGFAAINHSQLNSSFARFWLYKNMLAWRPFSRVWNNFVVDVLSKGDGSSRTQQILHSFDGLTTFPDFFDEERFCETEKLFFYPPAEESDDELEVEAEENEEEEEEEDEEGNIIPRRRKEVEPHPFLDHISIIQRGMRRRRVYERVLRHLTSRGIQETVTHGLGSRHASEEVEWMFPSDGAVIEVERSVANTKQVQCLVSPPRGLEFGFVAEEPCRTAEGAVLESVPSCIRSFVDVGRVVQVRTEVVADNSVEAEKKAYEASVEEAKVEAKRQLEALQIAKKNAKGRDKAVGLPTLQELEQGCINSIPKPQTREKCPPTLQVSALFLKGSVVVCYCELEECLLVKPFRPSHNVNLSIRVWRSNRVDTIVLHTVSHLRVHIEFIELFSPQSQGYRILLSHSGTYITERENQTLVITSGGACTLRSMEGIIPLASLQYSKNVDPSTKSVVVEREDGVKVVHHSEKRRCIYFGCNVWVTQEGREWGWTVSGLPMIKGNGRDRVFGVDAGVAELRFDLAKNVGYLTCPQEKYYAVIDWIEYRMHVAPIDDTSVYTIDCAFGGIYGEVISSASGSGEEQRKTIYRVSPFGRCAEEQDGLLVFPEGYHTPERQPAMRLLEIWEPSFVETLQGTDVRVEYDALHLMEGFSAKHMLSFAARTRLNPADAVHKAIEGFYGFEGLESLKCAIGSNERDRRVLTCTAVSASDRSSFVVFMEASSALLVMKTFLRVFHSLYSCPFEVKTKEQEIKEYLLAVKATPWSTSQRSKAVLPTAVAELHHLQPSFAKTFLLWYWLVRSSFGGALDLYFFNSFFDPKRVERGYQDALRYLSLTLPLAQREHLIPHLNEARDVTENPVLRLHKGVEHAAESASPLEEEKARHQRKEDSALPSNSRVEPSGWDRTGRLHYWKTVTADITPVEIQKSDVLVSKKDLASQGSSCRGPTSGVKAKRLPLGTPIPLMVSKLGHSGMKTATTNTTRGSQPMIRCYPDCANLGSIKAQRCYAAVFCVTNMSTVPCRYRVVVPQACKPFSSVRYPRHFLAPGLTEGVEVRISGGQPVGTMEMNLLLAHEGGTNTINVRWNTVEEERDVNLSPFTLCVGGTPLRFVPGATSRFKRRKSDDLALDEEILDDANSSVDEVDNSIVDY